MMLNRKTCFSSRTATRLRHTGLLSGLAAGSSLFVLVAACSSSEDEAVPVVGAGCAVGQADCGGYCASLSSDPLNCGTCDWACSGGMLCSAGTCVANCAATEEQCGGSCVNTATDPSHCGTCTGTCGGGERCEGGSCVAVPDDGAAVGGHAGTETGGTGNGSGGTGNAAGGAEVSATGGIGDDTGGTGNSSGGTSSATGGTEVSATGGTGNDTGGTGNDTGGTASGGTQVSTGGTETGTGGTETGTGGTETGGGSSAGEAPSNPNADCAARSLLAYLYDITGNHTLSGQESMFSDSRNTPFPSQRDTYVHNQVSKYPALYSSDFGDVATNNLNNRQNVVNNALAYAEAGSVVQLHYHMIQPDQADGSGFNTMSQFSQGNLYSASNMDAILTPGTSLNQEHLRRLDTLAGYLGQLQDAGVAVLWRPFHEMNGDWFWWCSQPRFKELWIQEWEYLTVTHGLNNLLWVWSVNHFSGGWGGGSDYGLDQYYPGHEYVDVLGVDVYLEYGHNYDQYVHDELLRIGGGKPIAFTENGEMPDMASMGSSQPNWVFWSTWWGFEDEGNGNSAQLYQSNYNLERVLTQDEVNVAACN